MEFEGLQWKLCC